jgi:hypothetical protein
MMGEVERSRSQRRGGRRSTAAVVVDRREEIVREAADCKSVVNR